MLITLLLFLVILSVLVLIHEAGHFFVARKFGIKVEEFGFGFPPRVFGVKKGETIYSINALPFGGFVKLYGEDDAGMGKIGGKEISGLKDKDAKRAFFSKPAWQRALVIFAGVVMNTLLAFLIFYIFLGISNFKTTLPLLTDHRFTNVNQQNFNDDINDVVVSIVSPNSPADTLNMDTPAAITHVDGTLVQGREEFIKYINDHKGKEVQLSWKELETGATKSKSVTPRKNPPKNEGSLGVAFVPITVLSYESPVQKMLSGVSYSYDLLSYTFDVMGMLISTSIKTGDARPVGEGVSGPVGIFSVVGEILKLEDVREMTLALLNLTGALSISLAFFNVLPIPALDGGRLFFIIIEMVTRKRVNPRFEALAHAIGLFVLLGLLALITLFDISKLLR